MPTRFLSRPGALRLLIALGASLGVAPALPAQFANAPLAVNNEVVNVTTPRSTVVVVEQFTKVLKAPNKITHVDGFDQGIVDVTALSPRELQLRGVAPGVTRIVITDERNQRFEVDARVISRLQAHLSRLFQDANIEVVHIGPDAGPGSIVLRGWVTQPEHVVEVMDVAGQFYPPANILNQLRVAGVQQVQLNVKVMEVQRSLLRRFGFNFFYVAEKGLLASTPGQLTTLTALDTLFGDPGQVSGTIAGVGEATLAGGVVGDSAAFQGFLEALKQEQLLKILAEPKLVTTNGRPANMLAGGEFPMPIASGLGTTTIQWREFGVRMEAVPFVLGNGRLRLELQPEVSDRDFSNGVSINGNVIPALTTRRVNTQVEMKFGQTLMLAGLLSMRKTAQTSKVPFLGELPGIGAAFRRVRYDEAETELVILVTPELVAPMDPCQVPPGGPGLFTDDPTDRELFYHGLIEVPYYGPECPSAPVGAFPPLPGPAPHHLIEPLPGPLAVPPPPAPVPASPAPAGPHWMPPPAPGAADASRSAPSVVELEQALDHAAGQRGRPVTTNWARTTRTDGRGAARPASYTGAAGAPSPAGPPPRRDGTSNDPQPAGRARLAPPAP